MHFPNHFKCTFLGTSPQFMNFTQLFKGVDSSTLEAGRSRRQVASSLVLIIIIHNRTLSNICFRDVPHNPWLGFDKDCFDYAMCQLSRALNYEWRRLEPINIVLSLSKAFRMCVVCELKGPRRVLV